MRWNGLLLVGLLAAWATADSARADSITYEFTGSVSEAHAMPVGSLAVGDAVSGTLTVTTGPLDTHPGDATFGRYLNAADFTLAIGAGSWSGGLRADVHDDTNDGFDINTGSGNTVTGSTLGTFTPAGFSLTGQGGSTIWATDTLEELLSLSLVDWPGTAGYLGTAGGSHVRFTVASMQPVPEPATLTLFGLGAAGLACASRRRRKRDP